MQFFSEPGFTLPDYAHPDLAFQDVLSLGDLIGAPPGVVIEQVTGDYIEILLHLVVGVTTSSGGVARVVTVSLNDSAGSEIYLLAASPYGQPASTTARYVFSTSNSSTAYVVTGTEATVQAPLPSLVAAPGQSFYVGGLHVQAGEKITSVEGQLLRVPTGPAFDLKPRTVPVQSPVLV